MRFKYGLMQIRRNELGYFIRNAMLGFAALALAACQSAPDAAPSAAPEPVPGRVTAPPGSAFIDPSVTITPPGRGVPARYAAFSGMWAGRLAGMYEGKLAVLTVSSNGAVTVTYAWGNLADNRPGVADGAGRIVGNTLKLGRLPNGADASFTMLPDATLAVTYTLAGQSYTGAFVKQ
jgi:hypothetical protein